MADFEYSVTNLFESVSDTDSSLLRIKTGSAPLKALISVSSGGQALIEVEEGATFSSDGTDVSIYKRNENNDITPSMDAWYNPTVDTSGTSVADDFIPGGGRGASKIGGKAMGDTLIWSKDTEQLVKVTNTSGSEADIFVKVLMSEIS